jgi:STAS domain
VRASDPPPGVVVLELSESADLDVGSVDVLGELESELRREGVELRLADVRRTALRILRRSGLAGRLRIEPTIAAAAEPAHVPAIGDQSDGEREPVGEKPVGERGEHGVAGADAGEREHGRQPGLDEPEAARGDRDLR